MLNPLIASLLYNLLSITSQRTHQTANPEWPWVEGGERWGGGGVGKKDDLTEAEFRKDVRFRVVARFPKLGGTIFFCGSFFSQYHLSCEHFKDVYLFSIGENSFAI